MWRQEKAVKLGSDIGAIRKVLISSFRKPPTVQPVGAFEGTAFKPGFEIVKFWTPL
jgi:hypothetical protein